jgi:hypothetical protein
MPKAVFLFRTARFCNCMLPYARQELLCIPTCIDAPVRRLSKAAWGFRTFQRCKLFIAPSKSFHKHPQAPPASSTSMVPSSAGPPGNSFNPLGAKDAVSRAAALAMQFSSKGGASQVRFGGQAFGVSGPSVEYLLRILG